LYKKFFKLRLFLFLLFLYSPYNFDSDHSNIVVFATCSKCALFVILTLHKWTEFAVVKCVPFGVSRKNCGEGVVVAVLFDPETFDFVVVNVVPEAVRAEHHQIVLVQFMFIEYQGFVDVVSVRAQLVRQVELFLGRLRLVNDPVFPYDHLAAVPNVACVQNWRAIFTHQSAHGNRAAALVSGGN